MEQESLSLALVAASQENHGARAMQPRAGLLLTVSEAHAQPCLLDCVILHHAQAFLGGGRHHHGCGHGHRRPCRPSCAALVPLEWSCHLRGRANQGNHSHLAGLYCQPEPRRPHFHSMRPLQAAAAPCALLKQQGVQEVSEFATLASGGRRLWLL